MTKKQYENLKHAIMTCFIGIMLAIMFTTIMLVIHISHVNEDITNCPIELQEEEKQCEDGFLNMNTDLCGVYYPIVIEDIATNNSFYVDKNYITHKGFIPNLDFNPNKTAQTCIGFKYMNDALVSNEVNDDGGEK